jgi:uncharacterized protein (DUF433 family)
MAMLATSPHIQLDAAGVVRVGASRYKVAHLAGEHYHYGWSAEELLRQHPDLRPEEVYAALTYFYDHFEELVAKLQEGSNRGGNGRATTLSRDELLKRKNIADPS